MRAIELPVRFWMGNFVLEVAHPNRPSRQRSSVFRQHSLCERNALTSLFAIPCAERDTSGEIPKPCIGGPAGETRSLFSLG
jgi:hypothetical protein